MSDQQRNVFLTTAIICTTTVADAQSSPLATRVREIIKPNGGTNNAYWSQSECGGGRRHEGRWRRRCHGRSKRDSWCRRFETARGRLVFEGKHAWRGQHRASRSRSVSESWEWQAFRRSLKVHMDQQIKIRPLMKPRQVR